MKLNKNIVRRLRSICQQITKMIICIPIVFLTLLAGQSSAHAISIDITIGRLGQISQRYDVVYVNNPSPVFTTFQLSLTKSVSSFDVGKYDVYYGVILPDRTVTSWVPSDGVEGRELKLVLGLLPLVRNASFEANEQPVELAMARTAAGHVFTPGDPLGDYKIFCIVVFPDANPSDIFNWAGFGSKIVTAK